MDNSAQTTSFRNRLFSSARQGLRKGIFSFLRLCTIMVPVYIVVAVLQVTAVLDHISRVFEPFMVYFGLPGGTALAYVTGTFVNLYAALAVLAGIPLDTRQITILAIMMGISHSQIMETAIMLKMKARPFLVTSFRVCFSLGTGLVLNLVLPG